MIGLLPFAAHNEGHLVPFAILGCVGVTGVDNNEIILAVSAFGPDFESDWDILQF